MHLKSKIMTGYTLKNLVSFFLVNAGLRQPSDWEWQTTPGGCKKKQLIVFDNQKNKKTMYMPFAGDIKIMHITNEETSRKATKKSSGNFKNFWANLLSLSKAQTITRMLNWNS